MSDRQPTTALLAEPKPPKNASAARGAADVVFNSLTLDVGRILAASAIFYFHVGLFRHYPLSAYGEFAVEYFVMLSGVSFILFSSPKPATPTEYLKYIGRRLTALLPVFCLVNVGLYLAGFVYPSALGRPYRLVEFLASTTGVSMYLGWKYLSTVMWFMPFILQVYLLIPLVDWCARRVRPLALVLAAFGLSCLFVRLLLFFVKDDMAAASVCKHWSPIFRLPEVCVGVIVGRMVLQRSNYWPGMLAVAAFGILSLSVSLLESASFLAPLFMPCSGFLVPAILFVAAALIAPLLRGVKAKIIRLLGVSSFFFYLVHASPLVVINRRFGDQTAVWTAYFLACWLFAAGFTLTLAKVQNMLKGGGPERQN